MAHYFRHCFWGIFEDYDKRIRERLRSLLHKRHRRNPLRLTKQRRWPNDFFKQEGLLSLQATPTRFVQSHCGPY
jgi:RNA-directed DNA polymerase